MTEPQPHDNYTTVAQPVTITISREWATFLARAQAARNSYRSHHVERIAVVDLHNLTIGQVIAFEKD